MKQEELDKLVERYFDGDTTLSEESTLRQLLATGRYDSEAAREAMAVMGYTVSVPRVGQRSFSRRKTWTVAASIAVLVIAGAGFLFMNQGNSRSEYIAWVNGVRIDNPARVMELAEKDLAEAAEASEGVMDETSDCWAEIAEQMEQLNQL